MYNPRLEIEMPAPPEGHERQCKARSRKTHRQCRRWALVGSNYCQFHGGRRARNPMLTKGKWRLPSFYSKHLGPTLKKRVEELLNKPHDEQVSLYHELSIARATACRALDLSKPLWDENQSKKLNPETKALLLTTVQQAMIHVKDLVVAASRLEKEAGEKVSIKVLNLIVMQICSAVNDVCGTENLELAKAIEKRINEKVRLPLNARTDAKIEVKIE